MAYRNGNYSAFYVDSPFDENNLGAHATRDFVYYNLLRAWKGTDSSFPFIDSHDKNYNVRDGSNWEKTLKPRIHDRINRGLYRIVPRLPLFAFGVQGLSVSPGLVVENSLQ